MIIEAKAARATPSNADPAQRYALKEVSRGPGTIFGLTALLAGVTVWLKSVLPGWTAEPAFAQVPDGDAPARPAPSLRLVHSRPNDDAPQAESEDSADALSFALGLVVRPIRWQQTLPMESAIDRYLPPEAPLVWQDLSPSGLALPAGGAGAATPADGGAEIVSLRRGDPPDPGSGGQHIPDVESPATEPDSGFGGEPANPNSPGSAGAGNGGDSGTPSPAPAVQSPGVSPGDTPAKGEPTNRAPRSTGPVILADVGLCSVLAIGLSDLLRNAVDPDGDSLSITSIAASHGSVVQTGDGWTYRPDWQSLGPVTLTYSISDGEFSVAQIATFSVIGRSFVGGTDLDDILMGSACPDDMYGGAGDDRIDGFGGDDVIAGGDGNDLLRGSDGDDVIFGGTGDDVIHGGDGRDQIWGGAGSDQIYGEAGEDVIFGEAGDDFLSGGTGEDVIAGGAGDDVIHGDAGDDVLDGGLDDDLIRGGEGADIVHGGRGRDQLWGGADDDRVAGEGEDDIIFGDAGNDHLSGGDGDDVAAGGTGDDVILGDAGDDVLDGGDGADKVQGGDGDDTIRDGAGRDHVLGEAGADTIVATLDATGDHLDGGEGCDLLDYSAATEGLAIDLVNGTASGLEIGEDVILGFEVVHGGSGDDHFVAGDAPVTLAGGKGENIFEFLGAQPASPAQEPLMFEILDFNVGDRIRMSKYDLFEKAFDKFEDEFERIYGEDIDDDDVRIRYRHETDDMRERTIIEADFNRDSSYETTIALEGRHLLVIVEHA